MERPIKPYYKQVLEFYYKHDSKELHRLVNKIVNAKFGGVANHDMPEFFSEAGDVLSDISLNDKYDASKGDFEGYLYKVLEFAFIDMLKKQTRDKRTTKIEIEIDGEKKKIPVKDISLDAPIGDDENTTIGDMIADKKTIEEEIFKEKDNYSYKMVLYLSRLSEVQKEVLRLIIAGYSPSEIREELHITNKQYDDCQSAIHSYRNVSILF